MSALNGKFATRSVVAVALLAGIALQTAGARADQVNPREFQAFGHTFQTESQAKAEWRKPNGAEILGGFAGADDEVNSRTGEVRSR